MPRRRTKQRSLSRRRSVQRSPLRAQSPARTRSHSPPPPPRRVTRRAAPPPDHGRLIEAARTQHAARVKDAEAAQDARYAALSMGQLRQLAADELVKQAREACATPLPALDVHKFDRYSARVLSAKARLHGVDPLAEDVARAQYASWASARAHNCGMTRSKAAAEVAALSRSDLVETIAPVMPWHV